MEDDTWEEMRNYMKCVAGAFDFQGCETVFFTQAYNFDKVPHCVMNCVGVPYQNTKQAGLEIFFKQEMEHLDGEYASHKKIYKILKE